MPQGIVLRKGFEPLIEHPRPGIAFTKRAQTAHEAISALCEQIADAILQWPRLENMMDAALGNHGAPSDEVGGDTACHTFSVTSSRAWIQFANRPPIVKLVDGKFIANLVQRSPRWFVENVVSIGIVHHRMSQRDAAFGNARDQSSFNRLVAEVEADPLGPFFSVREGTDLVRSGPPSSALPKDSHARRGLKSGERFYKEVRQAIVQFVKDEAAGAVPTVLVQYARAIVTFAENMMASAPAVSQIFSSTCADASGATSERTALKKALKARGVGVLRWTEEKNEHVKPVDFPPNWRDSGAKMRACAAYMPSVLLSFDTLRS